MDKDLIKRMIIIFIIGILIYIAIHIFFELVVYDGYMANIDWVKVILFYTNYYILYLLFTISLECSNRQLKNVLLLNILISVTIFIYTVNRYKNSNIYLILNSILIVIMLISAIWLFILIIREDR